jgi:hypothetical protein
VNYEILVRGAVNAPVEPRLQDCQSLIYWKWSERTLAVEKKSHLATNPPAKIRRFCDTHVEVRKLRALYHGKICVKELKPFGNDRHPALKINDKGTGLER